MEQWRWTIHSKLRSLQPLRVLDKCLLLPKQESIGKLNSRQMELTEAKRVRSFSERRCCLASWRSCSLSRQVWKNFKRGSTCCAFKRLSAAAANCPFFSAWHIDGIGWIWLDPICRYRFWRHYCIKLRNLTLLVCRTNSLSPHAWKASAAAIEAFSSATSALLFRTVAFAAAMLAWVPNPRVTSIQLSRV